MVIILMINDYVVMEIDSYLMIDYIFIITNTLQLRSNR